MQTALRSSALSAIAFLLSATTAMAAEGDDGRDTLVTITPYVWASGIGGKLRPIPFGPTFRASKSFGEVLEDLDTALFVSAGVRSGRLVFVGDFTRAVSSKEGLVPPGLPAEGKLRTTSLTVAGGWRVVAEERTRLDLMAGARAWWVRTRVDVPLAGISRSPELDFVDPIVAARLQQRLGGNWSLLLYGDMGGFKAGSDMSAQGVATVNVGVTRWLVLSGGYRYLMLDWKDGGRQVDVRQHGPIVGATLRF